MIRVAGAMEATTRREVVGASTRPEFAPKFRPPALSYSRDQSRLRHSRAIYVPWPIHGHLPAIAVMAVAFIPTRVTVAAITGIVTVAAIAAIITIVAVAAAPVVAAVVGARVPGVIRSAVETTIAVKAIVMSRVIRRATEATAMPPSRLGSDR